MFVFPIKSIKCTNLKPHIIPYKKIERSTTVSFNVALLKFYEMFIAKKPTLSGYKVGRKSAGEGTKLRIVKSERTGQ